MIFTVSNILLSKLLYRYLPTKKNLKAWRLDKKVRSTLMHIIKNRLAAKDKAGYGNDLLGLMLEACAPEHGAKNQLLSVDEIIDECKTFFFAGQETTSHLLSWTMFLLSTHPEWQEKLREEVLRECGKDQVPTHDNKLKLVSISNSIANFFSVSNGCLQVKDVASSYIL